MKRFIISVLCVAVFFVGLGTLVENAGARFKSDEKALTLIRQARQAIGGDQAVASIRSLSISGKTTRTVKANGGETVNVGDTEIALQLPDKLMKSVRIGGHDGIVGGEGIKQLDVIVTRGDKAPGEVVEERIEGAEPGAVKKFIIKKSDGTTEEIGGEGPHKIVVRKMVDGDLPKIATAGDGDKQVIVDEKMGEHGALRQNELLRTTLSLLLSAPEGMDVTYTFAGEIDIDGTSCNQVNADLGGSVIKLFLSKASNLPVMMSYAGHAMPMMFKMRTKAPEGSGESKDVVIFRRTLEGAPAAESAEVQVRFADYRATGGLQLPYKWTTTSGGALTEVFDVTAYDVNPANIADKFQNQKVFVRKMKDSK